jgi:hypothetical protein
VLLLANVFLDIFELGLVMAFQVHEAPLLKVAKKEDIVSKRKKDKIEKVIKILWHVQWIVEEFGEELCLCAFGLDTQHYIDLNIVS